MTRWNVERAARSAQARAAGQRTKPRENAMLPFSRIAYERGWSAATAPAVGPARRPGTRSSIAGGVVTPGQGLAASWPVVRVIRRLIAWIRAERRIRRGIAELSALDDNLLADIGVARGQIAHASRYGKPPQGWNVDVCPQFGRAAKN